MPPQAGPGKGWKEFMESNLSKCWCRNHPGAVSMLWRGGMLLLCPEQQEPELVPSAQPHPAPQLSSLKILLCPALSNFLQSLCSQKWSWLPRSDTQGAQKTDCYHVTAANIWNPSPRLCVGLDPAQISAWSSSFCSFLNQPPKQCLQKVARR